MPIIHTSIPFPVAPLVASLAAAAVGVLVGLPALRIRGLPVAVVTLALGVAIEALWFHNPDYAGTSGKNIVGPELFGLDLRARVGSEFPRVQFGLLVLAVLVGVAIGVARLRTSKLGSAMLAVRANERSAAGAGIDVVRVKLVAFGLAAFIAGLGGCMLAYLQGNVTFISFTALVGLGLFAIAYVGGITSVSGGIVAGLLAASGLVATAADSAFSLGEWYGVLSGVALVFTVIKNPEGIVGPVHAWLARRHRAVPAQVESAATRTPVATPGRLTTATEVEQSGVARDGDDVVLSTVDLRVSYGGVVAVDGVDLVVARGTIAGLIGPNGAGKTTLLDALSGFTPYAGEVVLLGQDLRGLSPHKRVRAGLGRTFQQTQLYDDLSVAENVVVGTAAAHGRDPSSMVETLELLGLAELAAASGRRTLARTAPARVDRACADRQPCRAALGRTRGRPRHGREPMARRTPPAHLRPRCHDSVDRSRHAPRAQPVRHAPCPRLRTRDRAGSAIRHQDRSQRRLGLPRVHTRRSGRAGMTTPSSDSGTAPLLACRDIVAGYGAINVVRSFSLTADAGTVVAVLGPNGAGKTTVLTTLAGLLPAQSGSVSIAGRTLKNGRPTAAARAGLVLVPDDRALFTTLTIDENLKAARGKHKTAIDDVLGLFPVLGNRRKVLAGNLSGGEQQMLAVARGLMQEPRVLLIDEMSMGLAPIIVEELLPTVRRIADDTGAVIVLVEQHVRLALEVADRAMVLVHGEVAIDRSAADLRTDAGLLESVYFGANAAPRAIPSH